MAIGKFHPRHRRIIETWLRRRGYSLRYGRVVKKDEVDFDERRVDVSCQARPAVSALHECGHILVNLSRKRRPHAVIAGSSLREFDANNHYDTKSVRRFGDGLRVVHEELVAWERGRRLGRRLRLGIAAKTFQLHAVRNTMTYVRWLALAGSAGPPH